MVKNLDGNKRWGVKPGVRFSHPYRLGCFFLVILVCWILAALLVGGWVHV
jgi:hypothetical protein